MDAGKYLVMGLVFVFAVFLIPILETAIIGVGGAEPLKPLFDFIPIAFIASVFLAIFYLGFKR